MFDANGKCLTCGGDELIDHCEDCGGCVINGRCPKDCLNRTDEDDDES